PDDTNVQITVAATLANPSVQGTVGFLNINLQKDDSVPNNTGITLNGTVTVELEDSGVENPEPNPDGKITLSDLAKAPTNFQNLFHADIQAALNIDGLKVTAAIGDSNPLDALTISLDGKSASGPGKIKSLSDLQDFVSNPLNHFVIHDTGHFLD